MGVVPSVVAALVAHREVAGVTGAGLRFLAWLATSKENQVTFSCSEVGTVQETYEPGSQPSLQVQPESEALSLQHPRLADMHPGPQSRWVTYPSAGPAHREPCIHQPGPVTTPHSTSLAGDARASHPRGALSDQLPHNGTWFPAVSASPARNRRPLLATRACSRHASRQHNRCATTKHHAHTRHRQQQKLESRAAPTSHTIQPMSPCSPPSLKAQPKIEAHSLPRPRLADERPGLPQHWVALPAGVPADLTAAKDLDCHVTAASGVLPAHTTSRFKK